MPPVYQKQLDLNLLIWACGWQAPFCPKIAKFGLLRFVCDALQVSVRVIFDPKAAMQQIILNMADPLAKELQAGFPMWIEMVDALATCFATEGHLALEEKNRCFHLGFPVRQRGEHDQALASARKVMSEDAFTTAWEDGRGMSLKQAVQNALMPYTNVPKS